MTVHTLSFRAWLTRWLPSLVLSLAGLSAFAQTDPPTRVATLSHMEGSVAFAPIGQTDWDDAGINRPITRGDRLWTDPGARAELHLGSATLHMDARTFVEVMALDDQVFQLRLNEGVLNARVRQLDGGEHFEINTPQLALRAGQPGDYRIDVDPAGGVTLVTVHSGTALVYGVGGGALQLRAGEGMAFGGRDLAPAAWQGLASQDFDSWALARNRAEDQSISARYVPRDVVGYQQLDLHGIWAQDPAYGAVWYPRSLAADWAPYRHGRWEWIAPWGWTWIDDAPWGFAPFHYGRWALIGARWAWVPGSLGPRPVYAPALVAFVGGQGGGTNFNLSLGSGPGIAWFPLAPGEAWHPAYRTSPVYVRRANRNVFEVGRSGYFHQRRPDAITAVRVEDFNRGRPVREYWNRGHRIDLSNAPVQVQPALPPPRRRQPQPDVPQPPRQGPGWQRHGQEEQDRSQQDQGLRQQQRRQQRFAPQQVQPLPQPAVPAARQVPVPLREGQAREPGAERGAPGVWHRRDREAQGAGEGGRSRRVQPIN